MKKFCLGLILMFGAITITFSQQPLPSPPPTPSIETQQITRQKQEAKRRFEEIKKNGGNAGTSNLSRSIAIENIKNIYRKPIKAEIELLAPDNEDLQKYAEFLRQSNTGLLKLIADQGCDQNTKIVNVSENCLKYSMPGGGSSYSFRIDNYRTGRLADLTYKNNSFQSSGIFAHALMVNIGDVPIDRISLQSNGVKFLTDFQPVTDFDQGKEIDKQLFKGIEKDGFIYRRGLNALDHSTYILRSIAYQGNFYRTINGILYDELEFDKRKDVIIGFRVVRRDEESITIIWKQLVEKSSPKVKKKIKETSE